MGYSVAYTNGVIAVKENRLLGEKVLRFPEMTEGELLRALAENGFMGEDPVQTEEVALDRFIREYAPTAADRAYFLAPRDFHNLKALYKAERTGADPAPMLAPEGLLSAERLKEMLKKREPPVPEIEEDADGAEIGIAFDRAMYAYLFRVCARQNLKKLLKARVDMTNILTAVRSESGEEAKRFFIGGGTLKEPAFDDVFADDERREKAFFGTPYADFYRACLAAGTPFTEAERMLAEFEEKSFFERRFGLEGREPFLYYVFRRRAELRNVRMILLAKRAGVKASEIEKRLTRVM